MAFANWWQFEFSLNSLINHCKKWYNFKTQPLIDEKDMISSILPQIFSSQSLLKTRHTCCSCTFRFFENIKMSWMSMIVKLFGNYLNMSFIIYWKIIRAFIRPKGITLYLKWPNIVWECCFPFITLFYVYRIVNIFQLDFCE
jgi:hypothetical protein